MTRKGTCHITVEFGDCDPAGIAFYPNFFRWYDASCRHFFQQCGVPPWRELERQTGVIGTPVVDVGSRYLLPVSYGDEIVVTTWVDEWREKSFIMKHVIQRGEATIAEGRDVRIVAIRHPDDASRIRAIAIPETIRALCT